jgi:hypothetical protein
MMEKQIMHDTISFRNDLFGQGKHTKLNRMSVQMFSFSDMVMYKMANLSIMVRDDIRMKCHWRS